jgi:hypothetical protein
MAKTCKGLFETKALAALKSGFEELGLSARETFDTYTCAVCGRSGLIIENKVGRWYLVTHYPPPRKLVNPSGKSGYYKKS